MTTGVTLTSYTFPCPIQSKAVEKGRESRYKVPGPKGAPGTPRLPQLPLQWAPGLAEAGVKATAIPFPPAAQRRLLPQRQHFHPRASCCCFCYCHQCHHLCLRFQALVVEGSQATGMTSSGVVVARRELQAAETALSSATSSLCCHHHCAPVLLAPSATARTLAPKLGSCRTMATALRLDPQGTGAAEHGQVPPELERSQGEGPRKKFFAGPALALGGPESKWWP